MPVAFFFLKTIDSLSAQKELTPTIFKLKENIVTGTPKVVGAFAGRRMQVFSAKIAVELPAVAIVNIHRHRRPQIPTIIP